MECITLEGKVEPISLLTHADKIVLLKKLLPNKKHTDDLFLPEESFYGQSVTPEDPERMADTLFKWLGIKHRSVHIHVDPEQAALITYSYKKNSSQITLSLRTLEDPFLCAAVIAHGIIHHILIARGKVSLGESADDEALTDLGTIYAGFGVLVLNALSSKHHLLGSMGAHNYAAEFSDYCAEQRIVTNVWQPYVLPDISSHLLENNSPDRMLKPFIRTRLKKLRLHKQKLIMIIVPIVIVAVAGMAFMATRPEKVTHEQQDRRDNIAILRIQYEQCQKLVAYKSERWDVSDIFMQRQIEADKSRCASLKNRYNYEINIDDSEF